MRRALGFKLERTGRWLSDFVVYLERAGASTVNAELATAWAQQPIDGDPSWWAERLSAVRLFARYLQTLDPGTEIPPLGLWSHGSRRAVPYLYSAADVAGLMDAARTMAKPLRAATYVTLIGLLAATGMRVGEAIRLDRADIDRSTGVLVVRGTKFGKSREVPLHSTTMAALVAYIRVRDHLCPNPSTSAVLVSTAGTRLHYKNVHCEWMRLVRQAGLQRRSTLCRPRPHDLRHTFAVNTLIGWYRTTDDVAVLLPLLSTYLGHVDPGSTYWYLSAVPELLALAAQRLETATQP